jgi:hypothetical protein
MAHEHLVLTDDTRADEAMGLDLAFCTDMDIRLDFHEGADPCSTADCAAIQIDEIWMENQYVIFKNDIVSDGH